MDNTKKFKPALLFQSNMVLQREKPLTVWGTGPDGGNVSVEIQNRKAETTVNSGVWKLTLPPLYTSENETMVLKCADERIVFDNICMGEVWIAGGQSNMEFFIKYDEGRAGVLNTGGNNRIRFFDYPEVSYIGELEEYDYSEYGVWRTCDTSNLDYFSAVGYYFARKLEHDLGIPVGIVGCNWGGTPACAWTEPEYLKENEGRIWLDDYAEAARSLDPVAYDLEFGSNPANIRNHVISDKIEEKLMFGMSDQQMEDFMNSPDYNVDMPSPGPRDQNRPGGLYETMLTAVAPFAARGVIWYQGESDDKHPEIYDTVFSSMIRCWRDLWNDELPFLFVQLAPFRRWLDCHGETYPVIRAKQELVSETVAKAWMASIMDSGMEKDIHPKRKKPVGERLALLAEGKVYSLDVDCDPPGLDKVVREEGSVRLFFSHAEEGLHTEGPALNALELYIGSKPVYDYEVDIFGAEVVIKSEKLKKDSSFSVRFAYRDYCEVNLYNSAGLPAKPFIYPEPKDA